MQFFVACVPIAVIVLKNLLLPEQPQVLSRPTWDALSDVLLLLYTLVLCGVPATCLMLVATTAKGYLKLQLRRWDLCVTALYLANLLGPAMVMIGKLLTRLF